MVFPKVSNGFVRNFAMLCVFCLTLVFGVSPSYSGAVLAQDASLPPQPTGLSISFEGYDSVNIEWENPDDDSITGYQVLWRSRDGDTYGDGKEAWDFVAIDDDTGTAGTEYSDTSVTPETRYVYRVKAKNPASVALLALIFQVGKSGLVHLPYSRNRH